MHPTRRAATQQLAGRDVDSEWAAIYRESVFYVYGESARIGLMLAFYRALAMPRIAAVIHGTGETQKRPVKRVYDTALMMFELIYDGLDGPRGRTMTSSINLSHKGLHIEDEDYIYVLSTFIVSPYRYLERWGWRAPLDVEREAAYRFYAELGRRMNLAVIPSSYTEAGAFLDAYESRHLAPNPYTAELVSTTMQVYLDRAPAPARPLLRAGVVAMYADRALTDVMRLPTTSLSRSLAPALRAMAVREAAQPARTTTWFEPGAKHTRVYPHGYEPEDLGVVRRP